MFAFSAKRRNRRNCVTMSDRKSSCLARISLEEVRKSLRWQPYVKIIKTDIKSHKRTKNKDSSHKLALKVSPEQNSEPSPLDNQTLKPVVTEERQHIHQGTSARVAVEESPLVEPSSSLVETPSNEIADPTADNEVQLIFERNKNVTCASDGDARLADVLPKVDVDKITRYFQTNNAEQKNIFEIMKFAKHFDLVSKETSTEMLESLKSREGKINKENVREFRPVVLHEFMKKVAQPYDDLMFSAVCQIIRFVAHASESDCSESCLNISVELVLNYPYVEFFIYQLRDQELMTFYANSYKYVLKYVGEKCGQLSEHEQCCVRTVNGILDDIVKETGNTSPDISNNFFTRDNDILKYVNRILNKSVVDIAFILNYLNVYLQVECRKPCWTLREASLYEYENSLTFGDCRVMSVFYGRQGCVVIWRNEALRLLCYYADCLRTKVCNTAKLFLAANTANPLTDDLNVDEFVNDFRKFSFLRASNNPSKCVQTEKILIDSKERRCSSTQTDLQTPAMPVVKTKMNHSTITPLQVRSVGIQCSFQILLKSSHSLVKDFYSFKNQDNSNQVLLVPASNADLEKIIKMPTKDCGTDPIAKLKRDAMSQTCPVTIAQRPTKIDACIQTENENLIVILAPPTASSSLDATSVAQPNDNSTADRFDSDNNIEPFNLLPHKLPPQCEVFDPQTILNIDYDMCISPTRQAESANVSSSCDAMDSNVGEFANDDDEPVIIDVLPGPSSGANLTVSSTGLIKNVKSALKYWPPSPNGSPLTFKETGLSREFYFRYLKEFQMRQATLRAKVIVDNIIASMNVVTDDRVETEALKYNWPFDRKLLSKCYSKEMYIKQ